MTIIRGEKQTTLRDFDYNTSRQTVHPPRPENDVTDELYQCEQAGYQPMVMPLCHKYPVGELLILSGNVTSQSPEMMLLVSFFTAFLTAASYQK